MLIVIPFKLHSTPLVTINSPYLHVLPMAVTPAVPQAPGLHLRGADDLRPRPVPRGAAERRRSGGRDPQPAAGRPGGARGVRKPAPGLLRTTGVGTWSGGENRSGWGYDKVGICELRSYDMNSSDLN